MKKLSIIIFVFGLLLNSCGYDNFDEPTSVITGKVVYSGKTLSFRSTALSLQLWQPGFEIYTSVPVAINQNGTFRSLMFDGSYRLINAAGTTQPWILRTDTVKFDLKGTANVDYEVTPYFDISNEVFTKVDTTMKATCKLTKVAAAAVLENATLYVSRTSMCDESNKETSIRILPAAMPDLNNISFPVVTIPKRIRTQGYCYVRLGVKATNASERLYTQVQKVTF